MRVRAQDANGDMTFGSGSANFLVNSPQAVAQCVVTALQLYQGEWYLDTTAGMPWKTKVLGFNTKTMYDGAVQKMIRGVTGVTGITSYSSSLDSTTRKLSITATISTAYGSATLTTSLFAPPSLSGYGVGGFAENPYGE
jgi:hypothetical protein